MDSSDNLLAGIEKVVPEVGGITGVCRQLLDQKQRQSHRLPRVVWPSKLGAPDHTSRSLFAFGNKCLKVKAFCEFGVIRF